MTPEERRKFVRDTIGTCADDFTPDDLRVLANAPLMDANRIYLEAGKLSPADFRAREARILRGEPA